MTKKGVRYMPFRIPDNFTEWTTESLQRVQLLNEASPNKSFAMGWPISILVQYHRYREESERENGDLKTEVRMIEILTPVLHNNPITTTICFLLQIAKLKLDFDGVKCQNDNLQQLLHERCENLSITPQKRRRTPEDDDDDYVDEDDNNDRPPRYKRVKTNPSGFSRERIKYVLGGRDRGWGSTQ